MHSLDSPSFCRQAADVVHEFHVWLPKGTQCLNWDFSFCRQAAGLVHVFDFRFLPGTQRLNTGLLFLSTGKFLQGRSGSMQYGAWAMGQGPMGDDDGGGGGGRIL